MSGTKKPDHRDKLRKKAKNKKKKKRRDSNEARRGPG